MDVRPYDLKLIDYSKLDPATVAMLDQNDAERRECERLAPHNRALTMYSNIHDSIRHALMTLRGQEAFCTVPVLTEAPDGSILHERNCSQPIIDERPIHYCNNCRDATSKWLPFWISCGWVIVQIELCEQCSDLMILRHGAIPQTDARDV